MNLPRMAMVPRRIEFALRTRSQRMNTDVHFRTDTDVRGFTQQRCFCLAKTRVRKCTRMYTSGQAICKKANGERLFRTDRDVREIEQQRVCPANSTLNSVHGSTLFNRLFSKALEMWGSALPIKNIYKRL